MKSVFTLKTIFLILVFLTALFEAVGDSVLKKWAIDGKPLFFILGLLAYFSATVVWAFSLKYEFLSKAISIATIINLIIVVLVGVIYFKEDLSWTNKIGILLGILSVFLIEH